MGQLATLHRIAQPPRRRLLAATAISALNTVLAIATLSAIGGLLVAASAHPGLSAVAGPLVLVELLSIARAPVRYADRLLSHGVAFDALGSWRTWLFRALVPLAPAGLARRRSGDLLSTAVDDVDQLQDLYVRVLLPAGGAVCALLAATATVTVVDPRAGAVLGGGVVGLLAVASLGRQSAAERWGALVALRGARAATVADALLGADLVTTSGRWSATLEVAAEHRAAIRSLTNAIARSVRSRRLAGLAVLATASALLARALSSSVGSDHLRPGVAAAILLGVVGCAEAAAVVLSAADALGPLAAAASRLLDVAATPRPADRGTIVPGAVPHALVLDGVTLRYPFASTPSLNGFSASFAPTGLHALVGPSGSGKTSALVALAGLWTVERGSVTVDGVDLASIDLERFRDGIGVHLPTTVLFAGTVRANLDPTGRTDDDTLLERLAAVGLDASVDFLDRLVGERGTALSGGERARVSILRALGLGRGALLVDEPVAHLDDERAQMVWSLLDASTTTVLVTGHTPPPIERVSVVDVARRFET